MLTGEINLENGYGIANINYPTGLSYNNCIVISLGINIYETDIYNFISEEISEMFFSVRLQSERIRISAKSIDNVGPSSTKKYKLVLMKIN